MRRKILGLLSVSVLGFWCATGSAETVTLTDGRVVELKPDGTYEFQDAQQGILIEAVGCRDVISERENTDDFNNVTGYSYFPGFEIQYRVENRTQFPLLVRRLGTEFSRDYGFFYTLIGIPNFSDAIEPGRSLRLGDNPHLFHVESPEALGQAEKDELQDRYGCSLNNFEGELIYIDRNETEMRFPESAGVLDPLELLAVSSRVPGLALEVR